jgi:hypothetical protein
MYTPVITGERESTAALIGGASGRKPVLQWRDARMASMQVTMPWDRGAGRNGGGSGGGREAPLSTWRPMKPPRSTPCTVGVGVGVGAGVCVHDQR